MKRSFYISVLVVLPLAVLFSCSSGKKAYEQGDYYEAVMKSVNRLRSNPDHKKSREALADAYPLAVRWYEDDIANKLSSNDPYKWTAVVRNYTLINNMYSEINKAPGAKQVVPNPVSYFNELAEAKENAAKEQYDKGLELLAINTRESAKDAYYHFVEADALSPGYMDVKNLIDEARYVATLKVVVDQIPSISRYSVTANFFQDQIESFLRTDINNQFVRFYNFQEAEEEQLNPPDQILRIYFDDFVVGETHLVKSEKTVTSADSVKVAEVTLDDGSKMDVMRPVTAKLTTYRKEVISKGRLAMEIMDGYSNGILDSDKFTGEFVWFTKWGSYNGDERALTKEQLALCKAEEVPAPHPQDLFLEFTKPIYDQVTNKLNSYYRQF
jgi:hypothetical protein